MIDHYENNPSLFNNCLTLIDESFPGCKAIALNGIQYNACWNKVSTPFILMDGDELVAHAGIWPISFILNGKEHHSVSIHGVCVKESHRGRGYFQKLMHEVMEYVAHHFNSSILFSVKPYLYKKYPYKIMLPEYDFILSDNKLLEGESFATESDLRLLQWDNRDDINLMHQLLSKRVPLSNEFSIINDYAGKTLFILNRMNNSIYYSKKLEALIVYDIGDKTIYLKEIISSRQNNINDVVSAVLGYQKSEINKVIFQFCPDRFIKEKEYSSVLARPECCVMTSDTFLFQFKYFRYPELYWC